MRRGGWPKNKPISSNKMALDISEQRASGLDLSERGRTKDGRALALDKRLYFQLQAFGGCDDADPAARALVAAGIKGALYVNVNDPYGIGLLALSTSADHFVTELRDLLQRPPFTKYLPQPDYAMFGRTYAIGYESDLEELLLRLLIAMCAIRRGRGPYGIPFVAQAVSSS